MEPQTRILVAFGRQPSKQSVSLGPLPKPEFHASTPTLSPTVADSLHSDLICVAGLGIGAPATLNPKHHLRNPKFRSFEMDITAPAVA